MTSQSPAMRVDPLDPAYLASAQAEANYWTDGPSWCDDAPEPRHAIVRRHYNERFTGDPNVPWYEAIARFGTFRKGAVLGGGGVLHEQRILETNPELDLTFFDISPGPMTKREQVLGPLFPGRVHTAISDLNFIELPEKTFDVIISAAVIHHVTNLEYLVDQVQRALTPGGFFFLQDYVGESRREFTAAKKLVVELLYRRELVRQGRSPATDLEWVDGDPMSPFCCIRSADILSVFGATLVPRQIGTTGTLILPLLFFRDPSGVLRPTIRSRLRTVPGFRKLMRHLSRASGLVDTDVMAEPFLRRLLDVGDLLSDRGALLPCTAFAIYQKA